MAMHGIYEISVLTSDRDVGDQSPYDDIKVNNWNQRDPGIDVYYANVGSLTLKVLAGIIRSKDPDFLYLNSMYSLRFSIFPMILLMRKKIRARIVLAPRGMLQQGAIKFKSGKKKLFISLLNILGIPKNIQFQATDEQERKDILKFFPGAAGVAVVPNFSGDLPEALLPLIKEPGRLLCIYISRIVPKKNLLFFLQILQGLPESAALDFSIFGEVEDDDYWSRAKTIIAALPRKINVNYLGPLPHDRVNDQLGKYHVFVLPSLGENFGHAIFESFAAGRPVLISDRTPWRNLQDQQLGWDLPLDNPEAWQAALQEAVAADQETFDRWTVNCRRFAENKQDTNALKLAYTNLFN